jgi:hypothetical protein
MKNKSRETVEMMIEKILICWDPGQKFAPSIPARQNKN